MCLSFQMIQEMRVVFFCVAVILLFLLCVKYLNYFETPTTPNARWHHAQVGPVGNEARTERVELGWGGIWATTPPFSLYVGKGCAVTPSPTIPPEKHFFVRVLRAVLDGKKMLEKVRQGREGKGREGKGLFRTLRAYCLRHCQSTHSYFARRWLAIRYGRAPEARLAAWLRAGLGRPLCPLGDSSNVLFCRWLYTTT